MVRAEEHYLFLLKGQDPTYGPRPDDSQTPTAELKERMRQSGMAILEIATTIEPGVQVQGGGQLIKH